MPMLSEHRDAHEPAPLFAPAHRTVFHGRLAWTKLPRSLTPFAEEDSRCRMDKLVTTDQERFWNVEAAIRDEWVRRQAATLPKESWVLDVGAGASKYRPFFMHCRYETQDFCQYQGDLVKYLEPITYVSDITAIPLPDGCVDAVLCTEVLEHVVDPIAAVKECARLLKPGGKLFLTAPLLCSLHMEPYHFYGGYTPHWYRHWLPRFGLVVDELAPVGGPGRTCVVYAQLFYRRWAMAEVRLGAFRRLLSKGARAVAKVQVHWLLPRLLPKMDRWLGTEEVCSNYHVVATRDQAPVPAGMSGRG
jgi:SAM-dependent methyltransferase